MVSSKIIFYFISVTLIYSAGVALHHYSRYNRVGDESVNSVAPAGETAAGILLADQHKALASIVTSSSPSTTEQFAAAELSKYLQQISGARFAIASNTSGSRITLKVQKDLPVEDYKISIQKNNLEIAAGSDRALLYGVYHLLGTLGCVWLAPQFSFYDGQAEYIPHIITLRYHGANIHEHPRMLFRKMDVEEGQSHSIENLRQLINWMPKVRLNVLMIPLNYQGEGRVKWDNWRTVLMPELQKRGIMIEVGGHGYQNFINAGMENGQLFTQHPDWFGQDKNGEWDSTKNLVFNTANPDAVRYFINNVIAYLRSHPEIDIFDCWPPDGAKWAENEKMKALGSPLDRQATLLNQVDSAISANHLSTRLELIAYGQVLFPPEHVELNKHILVDVCPINQSFEKPIYDSSRPTNTEYARAIRQWRQAFHGDLTLYSYYRKYAWRSLPNVMPHYIQDEMKWYAGLPFQGVCTYGEPGDWYTYELNHYTLAALAWDPDISVEDIIRTYMHSRYGAAKNVAQRAYAALENIVRIDGSLPYTTVKSAAELQTAMNIIDSAAAQVKAAIASERSIAIGKKLTCLENMLMYARMDLDILREKANHGAAGEKVKQLVRFLQEHEKDGLFVLHGNVLNTFLRHYGVSE